MKNLLTRGKAIRDKTKEKSLDRDDFTTKKVSTTVTSKVPKLASFTKYKMNVDKESTVKPSISIYS